MGHISKLFLAALLAFPSIAWSADRLNVYPIDTCAVAKKNELGSMGKPIIKEIEGREFRLCCKGCNRRLENNTAKIAESVDQRIAEQQKKTYPMTSCIVSGEPLDEDAVDVVVQNTLIRVCCNNCARKVKARPAPYLKKLDQMVVGLQGKNYPLTTCAVSGEPLEEGETIDLIVGNRLIRVCCKGCVKGVKKDPAAVLKAVEAGWAAKKGSGKEKKPKGATTQPKKG